MKKRLLLALAVLTGLFLLSASIVWADTPAPVEKTGQTSCWDSSWNPTSCAGTGQDGEYQKGAVWPSPRFTDNGDGTVTDNLTGLMWAKDAQEIPGAMNWADAITASESLSLGTAGCSTSYIDWRLPNVKELESLLDLSNGGPALASGHPFTNVMNTDYWSSTTAKYRPSNAWLVNMGGSYVWGDYGTNGKTHTRYVWPVRDDVGAQNAPVEKTGQTSCWDSSGSPISCRGTGQDGAYQKGAAWPSPRFTDNGDGTVTDNLTGLMWAKDAQAIPGIKNWADAITASESLSLGTAGCSTSYVDWRLPNRKELESLIDFSNDSPALPSGHPFTNLVNNYYWSSTTREGVPHAQQAWQVLLSAGNCSTAHKTDTVNYKYVWPVRGGN